MSLLFLFLLKQLIKAMNDDEILSENKSGRKKERKN